MKHFIRLLLVFAIAVIWTTAVAQAATWTEDTRFLEPKGNFFSDVWDAAGDVADRVGDVASRVGDAAGDVADRVADAAGNVVSHVGDAAGTVADRVGDMASNVGDAANGAVSRVGEAWHDATEAAGQAWQRAGEAVDGVWNNVTGAFEPIETPPLIYQHGEADAPKSTPAPETLKFYLGTVVNTGKDNGYSGNTPICMDDPHFGWTLGRFYVSGFTRVFEDDGGNPVFLKTVGDTVALHFELYQDIDRLDGDEQVVICEDQDGYDLRFGLVKTNLGRGALIVKHTDYQNLAKEPTLYVDFLSAKVGGQADTTIDLFEEGDYDVALNYEIESPARVFGTSMHYDVYSNYRIPFRYAVRNGNCMVYPFDVATRAELTNSAITQDGFYLDLARSRYLDINIKKQVLAEGAAGLTEDTRFNRPAKDGDRYTDEGVYTITAYNRYTQQQTVKQLYVGTNRLLKAYATTGLSVDEIKSQLARGAQITDDGTLMFPTEREEIKK
ncbi:MAG: hypothetical protein RSC06_14855 [Clostridia bacterium]